MIPAAYAWLGGLGTLPRMVNAGLELLGVHEGPGSVDNPTILAWAKEVGLEHTFTADSIPWCGLFVALVAARAGRPLAASPLWALSWAKWGDNAGQPSLGDVLVFQRTGGGHVGIYIGEDATAYHVLGGNQGDQVSIVRVEKRRLYAARSPLYVNRPESAVPHIVATGGALSQNEA